MGLGNGSYITQNKNGTRERFLYYTKQETDGAANAAPFSQLLNLTLILLKYLFYTIRLDSYLMMLLYEKRVLIKEIE